jgi:hypothetical protein
MKHVKLIGIIITGMVVMTASFALAQVFGTMIISGVGSRQIGPPVVSAAGGATVSFGAFASRPACSSSPFIYGSNNSPIVEYCDGSSDVQYHYGSFLVVPFGTADTSWFNQSSATLTTDTAAAGVVLTGTGNNASNTQARIKAVPSTPYTQIGCFEGLIDSHVAFGEVGLVLTNGTNTSTSGIIEVQYVLQAATSPFGMAIQKRTGVTGAGSSYTISPSIPGLNTPVCFAIQDDGTTRKTAYSFNRQDWTVVQSIGDTDFITPTEIGYFVNSLASNEGPMMHLFDWETVASTLF